MKQQKPADDFLRGFRDATHLSMKGARAQWAAFSRLLSDAEIPSIERRGYAGGIVYGQLHRISCGLRDWKMRNKAANTRKGPGNGK